MARRSSRVHRLAPSRCDLLLSAVSRGDVTAATAVLDADRQVYVSHEQGRALLRACVTAPNAVALMDLFEARQSTLFRGATHFLADMSFVHACRHGADVATVVRTVQVLHGVSRPDVEEGLLWATKTRNASLVEHFLTSYDSDIRRDYGAILHAAIKTSDPAFVLRCMKMPAFLAFLASLEASFEPRFIRQVAMYRHRHKWIVQAIARGMRAVVEFAAERAPLVTADVVFVHHASCPNGAASYAHLRSRRETLNDQIEEFHRAIRAGNLFAVHLMLEDVPVLRRSSMDDGETALMASAMAPNAIALLDNLRQHGATKNAVRDAFLKTCWRGEASFASVKFLWKWIKALRFGDRDREAILWKCIASAISHEHLLSVGYLLPYVRDWSSHRIPGFLTTATSDWTVEKTHRFVMKAIRFPRYSDFVGAVMDVPAVQALFKSLKATMVCGASAGMDYGGGDCYCDCPGSHQCEFSAALSSVLDWIEYSIRHDMFSVVDSLDKWWPALTRRAAFVHCNMTRPKGADLYLWWTLADRYVRDVTRYHFRLALLVQRRVLPGLDHLGSHIATYSYAFDTKNQLRRLGHRS